MLSGSRTMAFRRYSAMIGAAKALYDWKAQTKDKFIEVKGGLLKGSVLSGKEVEALKNLPGREQLLGMVAGAFQAPIAGLANSFYQCISKFAGTLKALEEKNKKSPGNAGSSPATQK